MAEKGSRRGDRIAGSGIKMSGSHSGAGLRDLHERLQHFAGIQSERGRSQIKHPGSNFLVYFVQSSF